MGTTANLWPIFELSKMVNYNSRVMVSRTLLLFQLYSHKSQCKVFIILAPLSILHRSCRSLWLHKISDPARIYKESIRSITSHKTIFQYQLLVTYYLIFQQINVSTSVTRSGEILPLWQNIKVVRPFLRLYLLFGEMLSLLLEICYAFGRNSIVVNGQIFNK